MGTEQQSRDLSDIVSENVRRYVAIDQTEKGRGAAKLARIMGWKYQRTLEVYKYGGGRNGISMTEVEEIAERFGVPIEKMFESSSPRFSREQVAPPKPDLHEQCKAFADELAQLVWEQADDPEHLHMMITHEFHARESEFWDSRAHSLALRYALLAIGTQLRERYRYRDPYLNMKAIPYQQRIFSTHGEEDLR